MSGGKKVTVGYRYFMGLHMGVCAGPVDAVREIRIGDRTAWSGNQTTSGLITIDQPELFGGEKREGGVQGPLNVMMGEATQTANDYLTNRQTGPQPAYRGILGLVFRQGLIAMNNPYIKPWAIKVRRILQGWQNGVTAWYSTKASITLANGEVAMNPAHIAYECLTNVEWGMGYPAAQIDDANFRAAADTFHAEGMGLCLLWTRQNTIEAFLQTVMDHAGAVLGQDRRTGLFILRPIRGGYTVATLPVFDESNVIAVDSYQRAALSEAINEISATFVDVTTGKTGSVTVQNLANITSQGGVVSGTKNYPGLPTAELATRVALRDLRAVSTPIARVRMRCTRAAYNLLPGDLIRLNWTKLGVTGLVLRVLTVNTGTVTDGEIAIEAAEDVYGLPTTSYTSQPPSGWQDPNTLPSASPNRRVTEAPYFDLTRSLPTAELAAVAADAGYLAISATRASGDSVNYDILTRTGGGAFTKTGTGDFAPTATFVGALSHTATTGTLANMVDVDLVQTNTYAVIGSELVRVDAINATTGAITIGRGVLDSVALSHAAGARIIFAQDFTFSDGIERVDGDTVDVRILPTTGRGTLAEGSAPIDSIVFDQRQFRPYPPGRLRINNLAYPTSIVDAPLTVSWAHRNRLQQNLEGDESGNIGPEPGTTYTLRLINAGTNVQIQQWTGLTGTSQAMPLLTGTYTLRVELWSVRDGLGSRVSHSHTFTYININRISTEALDRITTEGADTITTE